MNYPTYQMAAPPEEKDPEYEELMTLLQHANLDGMFVDPHEQAQALSKVRARLFPADHEVSPPDAHEMPGLGSLPSKPKAQRAKRERIVRLFNVIAAVLVVAALVGSAQLLFGPWSPLQKDRSGTAPPLRQFGTPIKMGSFEMRLKITPGPYFLGELLEADLSIINASPDTYWLFSVGDPECHKLLKISTTGGGSPYATDIQRNWIGIPEPSLKCSYLNHSQGLLPEVSVPANQTITIKQYVQLTSSGQVTLTAQVESLRVTDRAGSGHIISAGVPWDSLQLFVSALVPPDRKLSVKEQRTQVVVSVPPTIRGHLLSESGGACEGGGTFIAGPSEISGATVVVRSSDMDCGDNSSRPLKLLWWTYVVGAPGYALISRRVNLQ